MALASNSVEDVKAEGRSETLIREDEANLTHAAGVMEAARAISTVLLAKGAVNNSDKRRSSMQATHIYGGKIHDADKALAHLRNWLADHGRKEAEARIDWVGTNSYRGQVTGWKFRILAFKREFDVMRNGDVTQRRIRALPATPLVTIQVMASRKAREPSLRSDDQGGQHGNRSS